jgi:POT family proton-dependent oligopeptide transporter
MIWAGLNRVKKEPNIPVKFALGIAQLGLGFLVLGWAGGFVSSGEVNLVVDGEEVSQAAAVVPLLFLVGGYFFHTTGELCLSPIGLSMVTKLSPKKITAMVMGAWFLSSALAHHLAGLIALLTSPPDSGDGPGSLALETGLLSSADGMTPELLTSYDNLANYVTVFEQIGYVACGAAVLCFVLSPLLKKWMHLDSSSVEEIADEAAAKTAGAEEPSTF